MKKTRQNIKSGKAPSDLPGIEAEGCKGARALLAPFGRRLAELLHPDATRQAAFDGSPDQAGRQERQRDRHIDVTETAFLAGGDLLSVRHDADGADVDPEVPVVERLIVLSP